MLCKELHTWYVVTVARSCNATVTWRSEIFDSEQINLFLCDNLVSSVWETNWTCRHSWQGTGKTFVRTISGGPQQGGPGTPSNGRKGVMILISKKVKVLKKSKYNDCWKLTFNQQLSIFSRRLHCLSLDKLVSPRGVFGMTCKFSSNLTFPCFCDFFMFLNVLCSWFYQSPLLGSSREKAVS